MGFGSYKTAWYMTQRIRGALIENNMDKLGGIVEVVFVALEAGDFDLFRKPVSAEGMEFTTDRLAAGASLLRDYWWSAWVNSAKPAKRGAANGD